MNRLICMAAVLMVADPAMAAVDARQAARLQADLTPVGAERAGSADGRIPPWEGGLGQEAAAVSANGTPLDPYANETALFTITAANYQAYQGQLSAGQIALLKRYPDTWRLPVYRSHRSVGVSAALQRWAASNAERARLSDDGNGVQGFSGAVAFPLPTTGLEVLWNHLTRSRNASFSQVADSATPQRSGRFVISSARQRFARSDAVQGLAPGEADNVLYYFSQQVTAPSRVAGDAVVVHETLDQVAQPRLAWVYSAGQRRVRRAPGMDYDSTVPGTAGLRTADSRDMFNGAPDRYDWHLLGKKLLYVPYNSYRLASPTLRYAQLLQPGHLAAQATRYELHRVWELVATLKPGAQHLYGQRRYYLDEDTWAIVEADYYDRQGHLWRTAEAHTYYHVAAGSALNAVEVTYDLNNGRYHVSGLTNEQRRPYAFNTPASASYFSPGALRSYGVR